jgi:hypothetical protein
MVWQVLGSNQRTLSRQLRPQMAGRMFIHRPRST